MKGNPQNQDRKPYPKPILRERKTLQDSILTIPSSSDEQRPKKLLERVRDVIRVKHYFYYTEKTYVQWIRRYILFHNKQHPKNMGVEEVQSFLSHLAIVDKVYPSI
jgi:Phage integrase, N-terminal SAM-like domain